MSLTNPDDAPGRVRRPSFPRNGVEGHSNVTSARSVSRNAWGTCSPPLLPAKGGVAVSATLGSKRESEVGISRPVGPPDPVSPSRAGSEEPRSPSSGASERVGGFREHPSFLQSLPREGRAFLTLLSNAQEREKSRSEHNLTTLSSGSLGSRVDEERSQLRDLV